MELMVSILGASLAVCIMLLPGLLFAFWLDRNITEEERRMEDLEQAARERARRTQR